MATINDNLQTWSNYDWSQSGDEWSAGWGGTEYLWTCTILPRILPYLPLGRTLELAPGFGRWTQFLKDVAQELILVDLTERCIEACKARFASAKNIRYYTNDGKSLDMIEDNSLDFVFSWDSLVHVEIDVIEAYLKELAKKLKRDGVGFIHHSNLGRYCDQNGQVLVENVAWRAGTVTAERFEEICASVGLRCIRQELINWNGLLLNDCISVFTPQGSKYDQPNERWKNLFFGDESRRVSKIAEHYKGVENQQVVYQAGMGEWIGRVTLAAKGRPVYIWGTGKVGIAVYYLLQELGIKASGFIDSDTRKAGQEMMNLTVAAPDEAIGGVKDIFVLIGSIAYQEEIGNRLIEMGLRSIYDFDTIPYINKP
ncbi:methyltransferase domain-containing protein [Heliobacterium undosum]|uniref:Methyltransferase domain-containing protein n=1 Tax=Heliomicrobium undosum TaxID=121734 RepID=A0A845KZF7_9FIRM|nr:class I SAM-dependent methyltransferase [Heliomicrobium undosum]MZP29462.1 methyltransferase domain-containing protein [Heliomicrobium undosum]